MGRSASLVMLLLLSSISPSSAQSHALSPPVGGITFDQVIRLSQSGLSDRVIIAQINMRHEPFNLAPNQLLALKNAQVSDQVIEAMAGPAPLAIRASSPLPARIAPKPGLPVEPGVYLASAKGNSKIIGQVITFNRTGSLLVSHLTFGVKAAHDNIQLLGPHANLAVDGQPLFYFIPAKQQADDGVDAGDLVLVRLEEKPERRQFEIGARGDWRASDGISITHQVPIVRTEEAPGVYSIKPTGALRKGEYAVYLVRGDGLKAYIYDFSSNGE